MATIETLMARSEKVGDCIEFTGHICNSGYGLVWHDGKNRLAHRVSFELHNAPIMNGRCVMHSCDNRKCINPDHLRLGTHAENTKDMETKGRAKKSSATGHFRAKLTQEVAAEIRSRYVPYDRKNGSMALSRELGVSQSAVHACIRGITWNIKSDLTKTYQPSRGSKC